MRQVSILQLHKEFKNKKNSKLKGNELEKWLKTKMFSKKICIFFYFINNKAYFLFLKKTIRRQKDNKYKSNF